MTVIQPLGQEIGAVYTMTAPDGSIAVFNEPLSANYVGPLSAVTGLDSAEVRESFGMNVERDGGFHNNFYFGRRPFTLQGEIVPKSVSDRLFKIARLQAASLAMQANGKLEWTTGNGAEVFLNFRRQQPLVTSEAWVKKFFLSGVAEDPRIYGKFAYDQYLAVNGATDLRFKLTKLSGSEKNIATIPISVTNGENAQIVVWVESSTGWTGGEISLEVPGLVGTQTMVKKFVSENEVWQQIILEIKPTKTETYNLRVQCAVAPAVGNWIRFNLPMVRCNNFATIIGSAEGVVVETFAGFEKVNSSEVVPYNCFQEGNYAAPIQATIFGPITGFKLVSSVTGKPFVQMSGLNLLKNEQLVINLDARTAIISNSGTDAYGLINFANTNWWGVPSQAAGSTISMEGVTGAGATTSARLSWRNTWV
jgi:hypothetical protein